MCILSRGQHPAVLLLQSLALLLLLMKGLGGGGASHCYTDDALAMHTETTYSVFILMSIPTCLRWDISSPVLESRDSG